MQQNNNSRPQRLTLKNDELIPLALSYLTEKRTVKFPLKGYSMRPFLEDERDCALLTVPHKPVLNEPVLAHLPNGHWVLHRIVDIQGENITLLGDGNFTPEHCKTADIKASVEGFYRKGRQKPDMISGRKWRTYSFFWTRLLPIRRYLLFIYRKLHGL